MEKTKYENILVVNLQTTKWENNKVPEGQEREIIEIGAHLLNVSSLRIHSPLQLFVRPKTSVISEYCTDHCGIDSELIEEEGVDFEDACSTIERKYKSKNLVWATYGDFDKILFEKQCEKNNIRYPFNTRHLNVKILIPIICNLKEEVGLKRGVKISNIEQYGVLNSALDNSNNIAQILSELLRGGVSFMSQK